MSRYRIALGLAAAVALALCSPASAQYSAGQNVNLWSPTTGAPIGDTAGRPLYVTGGAGGGGDASAANQVTGNNSLATIATNTGSNATAANQVTGNNSLATIATNTGSNATAAGQTTMNSNLTAVQTPTAPGTATATKGQLAGCTYTSGAVTFTTTQQGGLSCGSKGALSTQIMNVDGTQGAIVGAAPADNAANSNAASAGLVVQPRPFLYDGSTWDMQRSSQGATSSSGAGIAAVEEAGRSYSHLSTAQSAQVKLGAGFLHTISVNTGGAGSTLTLYDNSSATAPIIAVIDTASSRVITFDLAFATGLWAVTASGTPADITVTYR